MVTIAGGIILAIILIVGGIWLIGLMFSGFQKSTPVGCFTMFVFGAILLMLVSCIFG
jgi:ABC-type transport system involved in cytochrome c biogenesis permease subunit